MVCFAMQAIIRFHITLLMFMMFTNLRAVKVETNEIQIRLSHPIFDVYLMFIAINMASNRHRRRFVDHGLRLREIA